jgi:hypothetical protein
MPELGSFIILDIAEAAEDGSDWIESRSWRDFVEAEKVCQA